ncbi:SDR family NAD(P)-dependent oxidoreductase [Marinovum sp.]|uniref:SDR family NAD(P)-dependent oxidoreductase n=1 Tax=Marinovum sp. TaxID=2024839 RepID=UPI003A928D7A
MAKPALFAARNCLVLGAAHPVGQALCLRLAAQGGFVVALDTAEDVLQTLASQHPSRIAPLALDLGDTASLKRLAEDWQNDPLHLVVLAHPLHAGLLLDDLLASVSLLVRRLAPVLARAEGAAVLIYPAAEPGASPEKRATAQALAALTEALAEGGAQINALALHPAVLTPGGEARVCQLALMMALPLAQAVSGAVMPVGRPGSRGFD